MTAAMQRVLVLFALLACASSEQAKLSPISRVVELLQHLSGEIEDEGKKEEDAYGKFICWGKGLVNEKILSNNAAESRIDMLNTYIADLDAGRIELTTERIDLEKELETIHADMEVAADIRKKEKADFELASEELQQGIDALTEAVEVLKTATAGHETGVLLGLRGKMEQRAQVTESAGLTRAVALGKKILTKSDALFLQRLLTGEVPTWDWKKLNRKANFKMSYKARSMKIQDVLSSLLQTFQQNLNEASGKEKKAQDTYDSLMGAKDAQKLAAQDALNKLEAEGGAKGMSKSQAQEEVSLLTKQVTDDKKYIADLEKALADKKVEWKDRQTLRAGELEAISKAISILHSDDARDLFKRSYKSQGYSFLQESSSSSARRNAVVQMLRSLGHSTNDQRLRVLAASVATTTGHFDDVIVAIDKMLTRLEGEEKDDLDKKEQCESDRAADTRQAALASRTIDENTQLINRLTSEITDLEQEIAVTEDKIQKVRVERDEAIKQRKEEKKAYEIAKQDDIDAAKLVEEATGVLKSFYKDNLGKDLGLAQKSQRQQQPGQAPPPPPATWEAPYGGKEMESHGILSVLSMIHDDIKADEAKGDKIEAEAIKVFTDTKNALDAEEGRLLKLKSTLEGAMGDKQKKKGDTKASRTGTKKQLDIVMKKIADAEAGCHYFTINYPIRLHNRQIEMDGLRKAKAVLEGARFDAPDPNREIKPGDAFMQQVKRH